MSKVSFEDLKPALFGEGQRRRARRRFFVAVLNEVNRGSRKNRRRVRKAARLANHWDTRADRLNLRLLGAMRRPWKAGYR